jgi:glyoxylase-like metal-dependent hydrolase (beta-lactamase superfamily II)
MVTIEEVLPNLFRVEIPLPDNPLAAINSYFVKAERRSLIIDTGMNCGECICALYSALKRVEASLSRTEFFITHSHPDDLGLVLKLATNRSLRIL